MSGRRSDRHGRGGGDNLSVKSRRLLDRWGVTKELAEGAGVVAVGPAYRFEHGSLVRLAFVRDQEGRLCVGCALEGAGGWEMQEFEPYSARTLGYYQRHLRRKGMRESPHDTEDEPVEDE